MGKRVVWHGQSFSRVPLGDGGGGENVFLPIRDLQIILKSSIQIPDTIGTQSHHESNLCNGRQSKTNVKSGFGNGLFGNDSHP